MAAFLDSQLVVKQLSGLYAVRSAKLAPLHAEAVTLMASFQQCTLTHVPREQNTAADALANAALDREAASGLAHASRPPHA